MIVNNHGENQQSEVFSTSTSKEMEPAAGFKRTDDMPEVGHKMAANLGRKKENLLQANNVDSVLTFSFLFQKSRHTFRSIGKKKKTNFEIILAKKTWPIKRIDNNDTIRSRKIWSIRQRNSNDSMRSRKAWSISQRGNNDSIRSRKTLHRGEIYSSNGKLTTLENKTNDTVLFHGQMIAEAEEDKNGHKYGPSREEQHKKSRTRSVISDLHLGHTKQGIILYNYQQWSESAERKSEKKLSHSHVGGLGYGNWRSPISVKHAIVRRYTSRDKLYIQSKKENAFVNSERIQFEDTSRPQDNNAGNKVDGKFMLPDNYGKLFKPSTGYFLSARQNANSSHLKSRRSITVFENEKQRTHSRKLENIDEHPQLITGAETRFIEPENMHNHDEGNTFPNNISKYAQTVKSYARRRDLLDNLSRLEQDLLQTRIKLL